MLAGVSDWKPKIGDWVVLCEAKPQWQLYPGLCMRVIGMSPSSRWVGVFCPSGHRIDAQDVDPAIAGDPQSKWYWLLAEEYRQATPDEIRHPQLAQLVGGGL